MQTLAQPDFVKGLRYRDQLIRADRDGADPRIVKFAIGLCDEAYRYNIPMFPHMFVRSEAEQERLFKAGMTKARAGESPHQHGFAVDVVHGTQAWDLEPYEWNLIGSMGKEVARRQNLKVMWGGDWSFYDPAHWELENWRYELAIK